MPGGSWAVTWLLSCDRICAAQRTLKPMLCGVMPLPNDPTYLIRDGVPRASIVPGVRMRSEVSRGGRQCVQLQAPERGP